MKKVIIKNKYGQEFGAQMEAPESWIEECIANNSWGKSERWVLHKDEPKAEVYDEADVLDEKLVVDVEAKDEHLVEEKDIEGNIIVKKVFASNEKNHKEVKLKCEYTIEIVDISQDYAFEQCISNRKKEYPTMEDFLNAYFDGGEIAVQELQQKRLQIKAKYPKPVKE